MKSNVAVTYQVDDMQLAANELADGIMNGFALQKNSVGLLYCYSDIDLEDFVAHIMERFSFPVIGCTCIASMDGKGGFHEMAATLMVLTADDCDFSAVLTDDITRENVEDQVERAFGQARQGLPEEPKLIFALPPYNLGVTLDIFTEAFNRIAPGVPVIGGVPSDNGDGDVNATIFGGNVYPNKMVLLCVSGNLKPVCTAKKVTGTSVERKRQVTEARENVVYRVGNQTFCEYMEDLGFDVASLASGNNTVTFVANPVLLENVESPDGENYSFVRTLHQLNPAEGSGAAVGFIPEGATLSICTLERSDIEQAAVLGMEELNSKIEKGEQDGYQYSTIVAVSCIGRYLLMLPQSSVEADRVIASMKEGMSLAGFYSMGEIGPIPLKSGEVVTFAYNESLVLCAF
ncbi:FIST C-terminal domain-containing protein [Christensenellaceae bacterium OttesenSCG-928-K19]|nr:FIST C-terminal domain-containing protein [Christensenellaceae bacterium OttesenSCG-928-K19]